MLAEALMGDDDPLSKELGENMLKAFDNGGMRPSE